MDHANVSKLATKEVQTACAFFLRWYICIKRSYLTMLLSRRFDLGRRSLFVSAVVIFLLWLQHEPSIGLEGNTGVSR